MKPSPDEDQPSLVHTLQTLATSLPSPTVTLGDLWKVLGERGLLVISAVLVIPFLIPISIPGVSTVFGTAIVLISLGIMANRVPWLPKWLLHRPLSTPALVATLERGQVWARRLERFVFPRVRWLTSGTWWHGWHGAALGLGGVLLLFPFGIIPFSNTLPGLAVLLLSLGILQRDGLMILAGYAMNLATLVYFGFLFAGALLVGQGLVGLWGE